MFKRTKIKLSPNLLVIAFTLWGSLSSCAFLSDLVGLGAQRPVVKLKEMAVENISLQAIDLKLTVQVDNPNNFGIALATLHYQIDALGLAIATGSYMDSFKVPANGSNQIRLPLRVDPRSLLKLMNEVIKNQGQPIETVADVKLRFGGPLEGGFPGGGFSDVHIREKLPLVTMTKI